MPEKRPEFDARLKLQDAAPEFDARPKLQGAAVNYKIEQNELRARAAHTVVVHGSQRYGTYRHTLAKSHEHTEVFDEYRRRRKAQRQRMRVAPLGEGMPESRQLPALRLADWTPEELAQIAEDFQQRMRGPG